MNPIVETMKTDRKYGGWLWTLKLFAITYAGWGIDTYPSPKYWRHFYDEGITAAQALQIDINEGGESNGQSRN